MRRVILAIVWCLLLGLLTSVAVAWTAAWLLDANSVESKGTWLNDDWYVSVQKRPFVKCTLTYSTLWTVLDRPIDSGIKPDLIGPVRRVQQTLMRSPRGVAETLRAGWPMPCLYYTRVTTHFRMVVNWDYEDHGVLFGGNPFSSGEFIPADVRTLPIAVYWPGLIIDASAAGGVLCALWLLLYASRCQRARSKCKRGRCVFCSYRLHDDTDRCPECGNPTSKDIPIIGRLIIGPLALACITLAAACCGFLLLVRAHNPTPAMHLAAYHGNAQRVSGLLDDGADPDQLLTVESNGARSTKLTPLVAAASSCSLETVRALLDRGADPTYRINGTYSALDAALQFRCYECARALLKAGVDPDVGANEWVTALLFPAARGDVEAVQLLLEFGARPSHDVRALEVAIDRGHSDVAKLLLEYGSEPDFHAMNNAISLGNEQMYDALLQCGGDPLAVSSAGETLLFALGSYELVPNLRLWKRLVDAGIDINARNVNGETALLLAAINTDDPRATLFLLRNGADPNIARSAIDTPLYEAVLADQRLNVVLLLAYGADPTVMADTTWQSSDPLINELIANAINAWNADESSAQQSP